MLHIPLKYLIMDAMVNTYTNRSNYLCPLSGHPSVWQHDLRRRVPGPRRGPRGEHPLRAHLGRVVPLRGARHRHAEPLQAQAARGRAHAGQLELLAAHRDAQPPL